MARVAYPIAAILVGTGAFAIGSISALGPSGFGEIFPDAREERLAGPNDPTELHLYVLPETVFELDEPIGPRYLMASITLELDAAESRPSPSREAALMAALQGYVRALQPEDLHGPGGLYRLREGVLHRSRRLIGDDSVRDVFISEMLVG